MSSFHRWSPFKTLLRVHPNIDIERYLRGFGPHIAWTDVEVGMPSIRLDVSEDDNTYCIEADVPGACRDDIELRIDGNTIAISAELKHKSTPKQNEKAICSERCRGKVSRTFSLPSDVDAGKAQAGYENGVLTVKVPKKSHERASRIFIG